MTLSEEIPLMGDPTDDRREHGYRDGFVHALECYAGLVARGVPLTPEEAAMLARSEREHTPIKDKSPWRFRFEHAVSEFIGGTAL